MHSKHNKVTMTLVLAFQMSTQYSTLSSKLIGLPTVAAVVRSSSTRPSNDRRSRGGRSETEKEKTKLREIQKRVITAKIFHGLSNGTASVSLLEPNINEVLRELSKKAGWVVEVNSTTYRVKPAVNPCLVCGDGTPTINASVVICSDGRGGGGAKCSTTASPRHMSVGEPMINNNNKVTDNFSDNNNGFGDIPLTLHLCFSN